MFARQRKLPETPVLEWIAAAVGLVFLIALLGVIGAEALGGGLREAPAITVKVVRLSGPAAATWLGSRRSTPAGALLHCRSKPSCSITM
jgi:hypothetical protein